MVVTKWAKRASEQVLYRYEEEEDDWEEVTSIPTERAGLGIACLDGFIFTVGQSADGGERLL